MNSLPNEKWSLIHTGATAETTALTTSIVDMSGWDGVEFIAITNSVTATCVLGLTVRQNTANSTTGMAALAGSVTYTDVATEASDKLMVLDLYKPVERYLDANITRTTANAEIVSVLARQYQGRKGAVTQSTSHVITSAVSSSPAEA